jgi:hypothetical protein
VPDAIAPANNELDVCEVAGLSVDSAGFGAPKRPPEGAGAPPNRLAAPFEAASFSVGGGPAGVVELPKLNVAVFVGAGVDVPSAAGVLEGAPNNDVVAGLEAPPNKPPAEACAGAVPVGVVTSLFSSFLAPKLKPPELPPPPNNPPVGVELPAVLV